MKAYGFSISGLTLLLETEQPLAVGEQFLPFLADAGKPDIRVVFRQVAALPPVPEAVLHQDNCYRVHPDGRGGCLRSFFDAPRDFTPYALAYPEGECLRVDYLEKGKRCVGELQNAFFHLGLEELLIRRERLCLHAACVDTGQGGILFSGPSGIGKSTQAALWTRYRGAKQINGDRPILSKRDGGWLAWGSPYAGSSRCHVNEKSPVRAIVMLRQAGACSLRRLELPEAFRAVWSGLTVHSWDQGFVQTACDLALELVSAVPVYELGCTPDEQAVECLERGLEKEGCL